MSEEWKLGKEETGSWVGNKSKTCRNKKVNVNLIINFYLFWKQDNKKNKVLKSLKIYQLVLSGSKNVAFADFIKLL